MDDENAEIVKLRHDLKWHRIGIFITLCCAITISLFPQISFTDTLGKAKIVGTESTLHVFQDRSLWEVIWRKSTSFRFRVDHAGSGSSMHNASFTGIRRGNTATFDATGLPVKYINEYPVIEIPLTINARKTSFQITIGPKNQSKPNRS